MKQKYAMRLLGGAAAAVIAGAAFLSVSATANGIESPSLDAVLAAPGHSGEAPLLLAQADASSASSSESSSESSSAQSSSAESSSAEASSAPEPEPAMTPVSYSTEQAERGEKRFIDVCEECHGRDLKGGLNGGPPLRGSAFEARYFEGAPASALFGFMSTAMPPESPGRFSDAVYADLMAYVLKGNGVKPGAELPSDIEALDQLTMVK
jgi:mono/diheme cytochrome c family protein